jgi:electron transport complex protein RnfD
MIMLDVVVAMLPMMVVAIYLFGWNALRLLTACVGACVLTEYGCRWLMRRDPGIADLSAVVTGILLALNLPPQLPTWMAVVGCVVAIAIAKQVFGGIGYNPFNPALAGRVALLASFPVAMTTWTQWRIPTPLGATDSVTTATPLGLLRTSLAAEGAMPYAFDGTTALQFFLGSTNGCLGEVSAAAVLLGGTYLLIRRCISWHTPVSYVATVFVIALVLHSHNPARNMAPLFHVLSGGLMLGAVFMATDMVTTPVTGKGKIVFGVGCGLLTMIIRRWGGYPEGVSFAILLMNSITPLINRATRPRVFGQRRTQ